MTETYRILFVCLGNICRSPLAEGVFSHLVRESGLEGRYAAESAGTGAWHVGEAADPRSAAVADRHGITLTGAARQVGAEDFEVFDLILAMDSDNLRELERLRADVPQARARVGLLREFDPEVGADTAVPDPYYGGEGGFDRVFAMVHRSCVSLLESLESEEGERH